MMLYLAQRYGPTRYCPGDDPTLARVQLTVFGEATIAAGLNPPRALRRAGAGQAQLVGARTGGARRAGRAFCRGYARGRLFSRRGGFDARRHFGVFRPRNLARRPGRSPAGDTRRLSGAHSRAAGLRAGAISEPSAFAYVSGKPTRSLPPTSSTGR
jgi:hypothetical protein